MDKDSILELNALDLLHKELSASFKKDGRACRIEFRYPYVVNTSEGERKLKFDLVVLSPEKKLLEIYQVCSKVAFERNLNSMREILEDYKKLTKADVFLVYPDEGKIHTFSLQQVVLELNNREKTAAITVSSFSDFSRIINIICKDNGGDTRFFFRGHSNKKYKPIPSIYRDNTVEREEILYHEAIRRLPDVFTEDMSTFDNLVKMQHYELPTRLLDVTSNPLVALYFACQEEKRDGSVLVYSMLQRQIKYYDSDHVCVLANLAKRPYNFNFERDKSYLVYDIKKERPNFDGELLDSDALHYVFCVLPKLNNNRIIKQDGAFFIFGKGRKKETPAAILDFPNEIIIKADAKERILNDLKLLGINESSLFPEPDKVLKQIKREFCKK